jgi:hypothetical protein
MWKRYCGEYETENEWVWNVNIKWEKELCIWIIYVCGENKNWILCVVVKFCIFL